MKILMSFVAVSLLLGGCGSSNHSDLNAYIDEVKSRPAKPIKPLPVFTPYESFTYGASVKRSPFDRPVDLIQRNYGRTGEDVKPDLSRKSEYLEDFDLGSLRMVGTIKKDNTLWALISDPTGTVTKVAVNNYIGKNHGKIVSANNTQIELLEIVSDGLSGWVERPRVLAVIEKD